MKTLITLVLIFCLSLVASAKESITCEQILASDLPSPGEVSESELIQFLAFSVYPYLRSPVNQPGQANANILSFYQRQRPRLRPAIIYSLLQNLRPMNEAVGAHEQFSRFMDKDDVAYIIVYGVLTDHGPRLKPADKIRFLEFIKDSPRRSTLANKHDVAI